MKIFQKFMKMDFYISKITDFYISQITRTVPHKKALKKTTKAVLQQLKLLAENTLHLLNFQISYF